MKGAGLLAIMAPKGASKGESDDSDMGEENSSPDMEGEEKKDAFRSLMQAIKDDDEEAGALALERFVSCCHDEE